MTVANWIAKAITDKDGNRAIDVVPVDPNERLSRNLLMFELATLLHNIKEDVGKELGEDTTQVFLRLSDRIDAVLEVFYDQSNRLAALPEEERQGAGILSDYPEV